MKPLAENRRARLDYNLTENLEAGVELLGHEVKSIKAGRMGLNGSYVLVREGQAWLYNASVPPYQAGNVPDGYDSERTRRLLLKKSDIKVLVGSLNTKGILLIPTRAYIKGNLIKLEIGVGKSRKKSDKREYLKSREHDREMRQVKEEG
jgi:SsrA-binding protein